MIVTNSGVENVISMMVINKILFYSFSLFQGLLEL